MTVIKSSILCSQGVMTRDDTIDIAGTAFPVWPEGQQISAFDEERTVLRTRFEDAASYHPALTAKVLALAEKAEAAGQRSRSLGGTKIYAMHEWDSPEADLVEARAAAFFRRAMGAPEAYIDIGWTNLYRRGEYVLPHSHIRALAGVVYMLESGDRDPADEDAGLFTIVDPRYGPCCEVERGRMTNPVRLDLQPGTMIIFPGQLVHCVNPYGGERPRITLSWNINREPLPGSMLDSARSQQRP